MADGAAIERLLAIGSPALDASALQAEALTGPGARGAELRRLLHSKNGFLAFESGLDVFPAAAPSLAIDLARMNGEAATWRAEHWHRCDGLFFFAADAFGVLSAIKGDAIVRFDPETGADASNGVARRFSTAKAPPMTKGMTGTSR